MSECEEMASASSDSSYASPKDHVSVASGLSDQLNVGDAPAVERLKRTETSENENAASEDRQQSLSSSSGDGQSGKFEWL